MNTDDISEIILWITRNYLIGCCMNSQLVIDIGKEALYMVLLISGPLLLIDLVVGVLIGILQAVTQIHEQTLTFVPKILAVFGLMVFMLPWMIMQLCDYTIRLFNMIPTIIR